jgi:branched-chain amino acid transport system permease protein
MIGREDRCRKTINYLYKRFGLSECMAIVALAVLLILPLFKSDYLIVVSTEIVILGLFAMSFNLLYGYMGEISFGHSAFFGVGAYATALIINYFQNVYGGLDYLQFAIAIIVSIPIASLISLLVGYFCIKLTGIYFAMLSLAFGELIFYIVFSWYSFTKGDDGIQGLLPPGNFQSLNFYYYFVIFIVASALIVYWWITNSPYGYTLRMIRENRNRAAFLGINVRKVMLVNFVMAGAFAGLAGALWGPFQRSVSPVLLTSMQSGTAVFMTLLGGAKYFFGPVIGSSIYTALNGYITLYTVYWPLTIGLIILLFVLYLPGGFLSIVDKGLGKYMTDKK